MQSVYFFKLNSLLENIRNVYVPHHNLILLVCVKFFYLGDLEQALALPSVVLEALQSETKNAGDVVARLQESLSLDQVSLEQPDPETRRRIRFFCMKAKTANRLDVVKKLREIVPDGTTGKVFFDVNQKHVFVTQSSPFLSSFAWHAQHANLIDD